MSAARGASPRGPERIRPSQGGDEFMTRARPLSVEQLEDRTTPSTFGAPWPDPQHLTVSFVPDGTAVGASSSDLFATLNAEVPQAVWQQEVLRGLQAWASQI